MADWLHCNICFRQPGDGVGFSLTNCGHVYCDKCVKTACIDRCSMCGSVCDKISLTSKMKPEVEIFFTNPLDMFKKDMKKFMQVMDFQQNHRRRFLEHLRDKMMKQEAFVQNTQRMALLFQDMERENANIKEENLYLKKLIGEKGLGGHGRPNTPGKQYSPVLRGSPGFLHPTSQASNVISLGRFCSRTPPTANSSISSGRLSVRTPPTGGKIGSIQGTQRTSPQGFHRPITPKSVPHPISLSEWNTPNDTM